MDHVAAYVATLDSTPFMVEELDRSLRDRKPLNLIYKVDDYLSIHVHEGEEFAMYTPIEPDTDETVQQHVATASHHLFQVVPTANPPKDDEGRRELLDEMLKPVMRRKEIQPYEHAVRYHLERDLLGAGEVEPLIRDPWIEDIHGLGTKKLFVVHKVFGPMVCDIEFKDIRALDAFLVKWGERMGRPVSDASPIVDGALPDGSRINIIYGEQISRGGSSWTVRKFSDTPLSVTQLIEWGTFDPYVAAYLWLCMEHGMSTFVSGETASGKTTTLNALLPFVPGHAKILTAEDTPEVRPPHSNWQQLVTREGSAESKPIAMDVLLRVGLRSRPDRIIVGEIRGAEGAVAFQAMQTGYPTLATFHASSVGKLIQRFTSAPIKIPKAFMPNLNVVLVQMAVHVGGRMLRRVMAVEEIEGYDPRTDSVITRQVFAWDPVKDEHQFAGRNNSYVLENLVAPKMGLEDSREVYQELERRVQILKDLGERGVLDYEQTLLEVQ